MHYRDVTEGLRAAYDRSVDERDGQEIQDWKARVRAEFLDLLRMEDKSSLLEVGAGTGVHGLYFHEAGLDVLCTDPGALHDIPAWCRIHGHRVIEATSCADGFRIRVQIA